MGKILALVGPTASGKTKLALSWARKHGGHILSCDSLLVYRGMDVGTAKPDPKEIEDIPHYGIDLVDPDADFTAGDFVRYARPIIDRLVLTKTPLMIVGGTGFYLKALICGVWDAPPTQPAIRKRLQDETADLAPEEKARVLHEKLAKVDAEYAAKINANDTYRVIRALEIIETTGKTMRQSTEGKGLQNALPYPCPVLGITRKKTDLERRIIERTNQMFAQGLVAETRDLISRYPAIPRALRCVGYNEVIAHLTSGIPLADTREKVVISTRQLAKKQMTFFRGLPLPIEWFELPRDAEKVTQSLDSIS